MARITADWGRDILLKYSVDGGDRPRVERNGIGGERPIYCHAHGLLGGVTRTAVVATPPRADNGMRLLMLPDEF